MILTNPEDVRQATDSALINAIDDWTPALVRKYPEKAFEYMTALVAHLQAAQPTIGRARRVSIAGSAEHAEAALDAAMAQRPAVGGTVPRPGGSIALAVNARLAYDANHSLAGAWLDAENKLTDAQFLTYQQAYQQRASAQR